MIEKKQQRWITHRGNYVVGHRHKQRWTTPLIFTTTTEFCPFLPQMLLAFHCATLHAKASSNWSLDYVTFPFQGSSRLTATMMMTGISWRATGKNCCLVHFHKRTTAMHTKVSKYINSRCQIFGRTLSPSLQKRHCDCKRPRLHRSPRLSLLSHATMLCPKDHLLAPQVR